MSPPIGIENISTPPRSPSKQSFTPNRAQSKSPSPQRSGKFVPSTILEQPLVEEAAAVDSEERVMSGSSFKREDVESIRVYAGDDVYALLADVENEISKMSTNGAELPTPDPNTLLPENHRIALHRQRSHEMLNGISAISPGSASESSGIKSPSPLVTTTVKKDVIVEDDIPMLANTVYKP